MRNVLAMGRHAYNPEAEAPAHTPEINAYRNGFRAALLVRREVLPWKTKPTGTSTRSHPRWSWAWAGYRGQALIVWRRGDGAETARLVRGGPRRNPERGPVERRTAATPD